MRALLSDDRWLLSREEIGATCGGNPAADAATGPECPVSGPPPHVERALAGTSAPAPRLIAA